MKRANQARAILLRSKLGQVGRHLPRADDRLEQIQLWRPASLIWIQAVTTRVAVTSRDALRESVLGILYRALREAERELVRRHVCMPLAARRCESGGVCLLTGPGHWHSSYVNGQMFSALAG